MNRIQMQLAIQIGGDEWWQDTLECGFIGHHIKTPDVYTIRIDPGGEIYIRPNYRYDNVKPEMQKTLQEAQQYFKIHEKISGELAFFK